MKAWLVRSAANGQMRTVQARSAKAAIDVYCDQYNPPAGDYGVKERGVDGWAWYKVS